MPWEGGAVLRNNFLYTSHRLTLQLLPSPPAPSAQLLTPSQIPSVPADAQETQTLPSARAGPGQGGILGKNKFFLAHFPRSHHFTKLGELSWDRHLSLTVLNMQPTAQGERLFSMWINNPNFVLSSASCKKRNPKQLLGKKSCLQTESPCESLGYAR